MRKLSAALIILLGLANAALAQTKFTMPPPGGVTVVGVQVVASCGAASGLAANNLAYLAMDTTGVLCTSVSGGGITAAVTVADGADVTLGAKADAICGTATGTCTAMALYKFIATAATSSIPAGTAIIGKVGIDQTTPGTTNLVSLSAETTKVIGTINQGTSPWVTSAAQSGTWTVQPGNTANTTPWLVASRGDVNTTLTDCSSTIASGGTAQNAFTAAATRHGFTIANIDTTEVMWINFTGTAAASGTASYPLAPATATTFASLSSFTSPLGMGINTALSVIAATTSHKFSCTVW